MVKIGKKTLLNSYKVTFSFVKDINMDEEKKITNRKNNTTLAGQQIVTRFYIAIHELINRKVIRGVQTFTRMYDIDRRAFKIIEANPQRKMFDTGWLSYLVKDFNVNAEWLLLGKGSMFKEEIKSAKKTEPK